MDYSVNDFAFDVDQSGRITRPYGHFHTHLGWTEAQLQWRTIDSIFAPEDAAVAMETLFCVSHGKSRIDLSLYFIARDGVEFPARVAVSALGFAGPNVFIHLDCMRDASGVDRDLMSQWAAPAEISNVINDVESFLNTAPYNDASLTLFSFHADEDMDGDLVDFSAVAEKAARTLEMHAGDNAFTVRSGERSVAVVHDGGFDSEVIGERVNNVIGDDVSVESEVIDLSGGVAALKKSRASIMDMILSHEPDCAALNAVDDDIDLSNVVIQRTISAQSKETTFYAIEFSEDGETEPTEGNARDWRRRVTKARLSYAAEQAGKRDARIKIDVDALSLVDQDTNVLAKLPDSLIIGILSVPNEEVCEMSKLVACLDRLPCVVLDGLLLCRDARMQTVGGMVKRLGYITVPCAAIQKDPGGLARMLRDTASSIAGQYVGIVVTGLQIPETLAALDGISGLNLSGPAISDA